jgi:hypothetical protein
MARVMIGILHENFKVEHIVVDDLVVVEVVKRCNRNTASQWRCRCVEGP